MKTTYAVMGLVALMVMLLAVGGAVLLWADYQCRQSGRSQSGYMDGAGFVCSPANEGGTWTPLQELRGQ